MLESLIRHIQPSRCGLARTGVGRATKTLVPDTNIIQRGRGGASSVLAAGLKKKHLWGVAKKKKHLDLDSLWAKLLGVLQTKSFSAFRGAPINHTFLEFKSA